jgi:hypothetical protein
MPRDYKFSRLLRLNSNNANSVDLNQRHIFTTNDQDLHQIRHVSLKSALICNSEYNIHSGNNVFNYNDGVARTVTLPVGQYDITTFLTDLNALVQALTPTLVISQNALTQKLNFTAGVNISIDSIGTDATNTMAPVLGMTADQGASMNFDAPSLPDLTGLKHVYIVSRNLSNATQLLTGASGEQKLPIFADVPINSSFGVYTIDNTNSSETLDYSDYHGFKNLSEIDIQLVDEFGRVIEFNGLPWILMLRVYS